MTRSAPRPAVGEDSVPVMCVNRYLGEADRAYMMRVLPAPVRMLYPLLIGRPWKKYAAMLRTGT